jgi:hypothetical protein
MRKTLVLLSVLWIVAALVGAWTPWRTQHLMQMGIVLVIAGLVFGLFRLVARALCRRNRAVAGRASPAAGSDMAEIWSARPLILFLIALLGETVWLMVCASLGSAVVAEGGYYLILLALGYALSRWVNSKQYVPVLTAILLLLVGATWQAIQFLNNPSAQFRFGPEIVIFAASQIVGRLTMLPLDAAVVWGAWVIGEHTKKPSNQASDATSEPAPGADSSAHQG